MSRELPLSCYDDAWNALDNPEAYRPSAEVEGWMRENWQVLTGVEVLQIIPAKIGVTEGEILPFSAPSRAHARAWMPRFLEIFVSSGGNTTAAAQACNIHRDTPLKARKVDEAFNEAFLAAEAHIADAVRTVLYDRAVNGWQEPVYGSVGNYQEGLIGSITKFDNSLLKYLAQARCEEFRQVAKDGAANISVSATSSANACATSDVKVTKKEVEQRQARTKRKLKHQIDRLSLGGAGKN